jgi:hypothetical protein
MIFLINDSLKATIFSGVSSQIVHSARTAEILKQEKSVSYPSIFISTGY